MIKKILITFFISISIISNGYSAGSDENSSSSDNKTNYQKAVSYIKSAKKYE